MSETVTSNGAMRRLKRSRVLHVSSLMATAGFTLAACGSPAPSAPAKAEGEWDAPSQVAYSSVEACVSSGEPANECQMAFADARQQAAENAPRFASKEECETSWGPGQCEQGTNNNGGSFFMPMLAGFMMARMMNGGQRAAPQPLYRECRTRNPDGSCRDGGLRTGGAGGYLGRSLNRAPEQAQNAQERRSSRAVSRGGFGGSRGYYGG